MEDVKNAIGAAVGFAHSEAKFIARARHVAAIDTALQAIAAAAQTLQAGVSPEIVAEELRHAHNALGEIVGTGHYQRNQGGTGKGKDRKETATIAENGIHRHPGRRHRP